MFFATHGNLYYDCFVWKGGRVWRCERAAFNKSTSVKNVELIDRMSHLKLKNSFDGLD